MNTKVEKLENNIVKLDIEIDAETAAKEYEKACKRLAQRVNIPGFRKGKAPRVILEKNIGAETIKRDVLEYILPSTFANVVSENKLDLITEPYVESYDFEFGKPVTISAKAELKPEVKFEQYKGIDLEVEEFKTAEDAMDKELSELAKRFTELKSVTDRETNDKDVVVMDFDGSVNGEKIAGGAAKNYMLDLENSTFIPGFAEQLVGKKIGEEFTIDVTFPENYHEEKLKGQPAQFAITIHEIKEKVVPELSDELAQKVNPNFKTVDDLKKDIQSYLDRTQQIENDKRSANKVFEAVLSKMSVEVQPTMIDREKAALVADFKQKVAQTGVSWEEVIQKDGAEKIDEELKAEALNRIKNSLMISEIAKLENITVSAEDLEQKISEMAMMYQTSSENVFNEVKRNPGLIQSLSQQALSQKVTKFLIENNNIKHVAAK